MFQINVLSQNFEHLPGNAIWGKSHRAYSIHWDGIYKRKHWLKFHVNKNEDIKAQQQQKKIESQQNKTSNKRVKLDEASERERKHLYHIVCLLAIHPKWLRSQKRKRSKNNNKINVRTVDTCEFLMVMLLMTKQKKTSNVQAIRNKSLA